MTDTTIKTVRINVSSSAQEYEIREVGNGWSGTTVYRTGTVCADSIDQVKQAVEEILKGNDVEFWEQDKTEFSCLLLADRKSTEDKEDKNVFLVRKNGSLVLAYQVSDGVWLEPQS